MSNNNINYSRLIPMHGTEEYWKDKTDFTPVEGEIIIYDPDNNYNYSRFKVGRQKFDENGKPLKDENGNLIYYNLSELEFSSGAANGKGENSLQVGKVGDYATEALGDYSLAVGYNKGEVPTQSVGTASAAIGRGIQTYGRMSLGVGADSFTGLTEAHKQTLREAVGLNFDESNNTFIPDKNSTYFIKITETDLYVKNSKEEFELKKANFSGYFFADKNYSPVYYYKQLDGDNVKYIPIALPAETFPNVELTIEHPSSTEIKTMSICPYCPDFYTEEDLEEGDIFFKYGHNAIVAGWDSDAVGESSHVFGNCNIAIGKNSFIAGVSSKTYSYGNVSLGYENVVGDPDDTDFGHRTQEAQNIISIGTGLKSKTANQIVLGKYNKEDKDAILIVGIGNDNNNRQNGLVIKNNEIKMQPSNNQFIQCLGEQISWTSTKHYTTHYHSVTTPHLVMIYKDGTPDWAKEEKIKIEGEKSYYFKFQNEGDLIGFISNAGFWNDGSYDKQYYAIRILVDNAISEKINNIITNNDPLIGIYEIQQTLPEVSINSKGDIFSFNAKSTNTTPNRLITYQELNDKNNLLGKIIVSGENIEINGDLYINFDETSLSFSLTDFDSIGGEK